ncbi:hypothetical protein MHBO_004994, partial [Bonamia ostreae]
NRKKKVLLKKPVLVDNSDKLEKLKNSYNSLLNKLNSDNFDKIFKSFVALIKEAGSTDFETFSVLLNAIFEKATREQRYSKLYCQLFVGFVRKFKGHKVSKIGEEESFRLEFRKLIMENLKTKFYEMKETKTSS